MILQKSLLFCILISYFRNCRKPERTSPCVSPGRGDGEKYSRRQMQGSITVEAAFALPLFFLAVISLMYMIEVLSIRTSIRSGMQCAAKNAAEEAYRNTFAEPRSLEADIVKAVGSERLNRSIVEGGSGGIRCEKSRMSALTAVLDLKVEYRIRLPIPAFLNLSVPMEEQMRVKGWSGYVKTGFFETDEETVYVTETGVVYHRDYHCNYLELSIRMVTADSIDGLRNKEQGKYYPCEHCAEKGTQKGVYITDYGNRYHNSLNCSGLKRTIYAVPLSEASVGRGACTKCGR